MPDNKSFKKELPFILNQILVSESTMAQKNELKFIYCASGSGKIICNNTSISIYDGDIAVINPMLLHKTTIEKDSIIYSLIISKEFCESNDINLSKYIYTEEIKDKSATSLFNELINEYNSSDDFSYHSSYHAAVLLLVFITRNYSSKISTLIKNKSNALSVARAEKTIQYIKDNITENPSINDLANQIHISKYYFLHEFKNVTGFTISQVKNILRCSQAKKLLADTSLSINEISEKCGFNNYSYFYTSFKKEIGVSPSEYRQNCQNI